MYTGSSDEVPTTASHAPEARGTRLRTRLFILSAAAIVPLALMAGIGLFVLQRQQDEQARHVGLELSRSVANAVDAELRNAVVVLETLATAPALDRGDIAEFVDLAERVRRARQEWAAIILSAPDGTPLVDTRVAEGGRLSPLMERNSFDGAVQARTAVTGNLVRGSEGAWFFPVRVPVLRDGTVRFVLSALILPEAVRSVLVRQQVPSDWVVSIIDANGLRVARSRAHDATLGGQLSPTARQVVAGGGVEGFGVSYTLEGERTYTPYSRLPGGWQAVLGFPTALADTAALRALSTYGGGIVLSILLAATGALWVARSITKPIADLRRAAAAVGRGESPTLPHTDILEIRDVAATLDAAAADLARNKAEREALLQKERQARESAEAADRAKDEFLAMLSHELRTPLNAVYGWAKMLQSGQLRDEATIERAKNAIVRSAGVQIQLIDDLLDLSRITSGKLRLDVRHIELPQVLQAALDAVRPAADAKSIHLRATFDPGAPSINGDVGRIQQIVWNLLINAVKFTPKGGDVQLRLNRAGSYVHVVVTDTGQGIAPEMLPHVFERFRQADSSSTRPHGGLGLGLALVRHLAELHGGTVEVSSQGTGRGATFTVRLPVALADIGAGTPPLTMPLGDHATAGQATRLDGLRVLVVDDDVEGLALAEAILSRAGAEVRTCASAAPALDEVCEWRPDVLVSDIEMSGEDGYALIRRVRALGVEAGGTTPAIALTAYGRSQDRDSSLAAGFNLHVPKPIDPVELTAIVADAARRREAPKTSA